MARTNSLENDSPLKSHRFGHAPALWLALPLFIGCTVDRLYRPEPSLFLSGAGLFLILAALTIRYKKICLTALGLAGIFLGAIWHQVKLPPQDLIKPHSPFVEISVLIEQAQNQRTGKSWTGMGIITDKGDYFRRRVALHVQGSAPAKGTELKLSGAMMAVPDKPKGFDAWIASQGATLKLGPAKVLGILEEPSRFSQWCWQTNHYLEKWLRTLPWQDDEGGAMLAATMLGRTSLLPEEAKKAYAETGTLHLFAISGLHIAGMAVALLWIVRRTPLPEKPTAFFILAILWIYVQVTGASPSSLRAWIMAAFLWAGQSHERATPILQSLALACATTLILQPEASNDPGFQLSYLAVLSIILVGVPASQKLTTPTLAEKFTPRDEQSFSQRSLIYGKNFLLSGLCISLAATLAGTPLTLAYFNSASWGGIFANVILVPLSEIPLILGMISLTLSFSENLSPLAQGMNGVATLVLQGMTAIAQGLAQIPHLTLQGTASTWFSGPLCAMCLLVCFFKQAEEKSPYRLLGFPALILILWLIFFVHPID